MSVTDKIHFRMMSLMHEYLYRLFRDPYKVLDAAGLKPGQHVLEVGCGPGFFTVPAAKIVGQEGSVCALDINPLAVERVRQKLESNGVANVTTVLADAAQTGLPDESFDLIFVFGFGHQVSDMANVFAELRRLLKPGGVLSVEGWLGRLVPSTQLFHPLGRQGRIAQYRKVA